MKSIEIVSGADPERTIKIRPCKCGSRKWTQVELVKNFSILDSNGYWIFDDTEYDRKPVYRCSACGFESRSNPVRDIRCEG